MRLRVYSDPGFDIIPKRDPDIELVPVITIPIKTLIKAALPKGRTSYNICYVNYAYWKYAM